MKYLWMCTVRAAKEVIQKVVIYRTIHSFWQDAVKMKEGFPAKKLHLESENKHIHIHITADDQQGLDKYERMRREAVDGSPDPY